MKDKRSIQLFSEFTSEEPKVRCFRHLRGGTERSEFASLRGVDVAPVALLGGGSLGRGFTLFETIVIVAVIAVVIGFVFYLIDPMTRIQKGKDNQRKAHFAQIQEALRKYYKDFGKYPPNPGDCTKDLVFCKIVGLDPNSPIVEWGQPFKPYLNVLPKDPGGKTYIYLSSSNRQAYYLYATLDREGDPEGCNLGKACVSLTAKKIDPGACGGICNYGVSSSNVRP